MSALLLCHTVLSAPQPPVAVELMALSESGRFHAHLQTGDRLWLADVVPVDKLADSTRALQWQGRYFMQHVTTDRYGEKHGWLYSTLAGGDRTSVQAALVSSGHAMAYGDSASLWQYSTPMPARITASQAPQHLYQWREVSGRVKTVALTRSAAYLNFGMDWREDFTVWIPGSIRRQIEDSDLLDYEGSCIQVRGWIHPYYGPRITLHHPAMLTPAAKGTCHDETDPSGT